MIGTLMKELMRALRENVAFRVRRQVFDRGTPNNSLVNLEADDKNSPMAGMPVAKAPPIYTPNGSFDWQILSEPNGQVYRGGPPPAVFDLLIHEPKIVLDVGCSAGDFGASVKERFPKSQVWGVEPNERAARMAASRLDRVLCQMVEEIDWKKEGVRRGDIDTVLLFDVLEHTYDPWKTLLTLRNIVSAKGQLLASIPNVRNVFLIQDLISGYWRYRPFGLLDITHIRFFTLQDMYRMFYQTGFRVVASGGTQCALSAEIFVRHRDGSFPRTIEIESAAITVRSVQDLSSLCTVQHTFLLQPAEYDELPADERRWIDAPHPPTKAYPAD